MNPWHSLPLAVLAWVENAPGSVLLHTSRPSLEHPYSRLFADPLRIVEAYSPYEIPPLFDAIEEAVANGLFAAGHFAYECGAFFEPTTPQIRVRTGEPLAWFGIYRRPFLFDHRCGAFVGHIPAAISSPCHLLTQPGNTGDPCPILSTLSEERAGGQSHDSKGGSIEPAGGVEDSLNASFALTEAQYEETVETIHRAIRAGEVYQLNFTTPLSVQATGSTAALYSRLAARQPVDYSAFLHTRDGRQILSFSPELFFRLSGSKAEAGARQISTQPMKGTARRGRTTHEDRAQAEWLQNDTKNRAENLMIVDLIRNDLGRICTYGSVKVDDLFAVERYPTLWQMTSKITGELRPAVTFQQIFRALFPCGSFTGAPKVRAMQRIVELEAEPRGTYTGAIGFFSSEETVFSVAIRTLELELAEPCNAQPRLWQGKMGVGSGIVIDSNAAEEFEECALKAAFLAGGTAQAFLPASEDFSLIETLLWQHDYPLLDLHLDRLEDSAHYFDFPCNRAETRSALLNLPLGFAAAGPRKVRLLLHRGGRWTLSSESLPPDSGSNPRPLRVCLSAQTTDSRDPMLFHKTTHRPLYTTAWNAAREAGFDDVLFFNKKGELTESAIANVFVVKDGRWSTPPVECGLLPGVQRRYLLESRREIETRLLFADDLLHADALYLSNAVRGLRRVELDRSKAGKLTSF